MLWTRTLTRGTLNRQQPRFMPFSGLRIFGLCSGCGGYDTKSDQYNGPNRDPGRGNTKKNRGDRQTDDQYDESNQVRAE
jgi:hypothetical protein